MQQHYVIKWDTVNSIEDLKTILKAIDFGFATNHAMIANGELIPFVELQDNPVGEAFANIVSANNELLKSANL